MSPLATLSTGTRTSRPSRCTSASFGDSSSTPGWRGGPAPCCATQSTAPTRTGKSPWPLGPLADGDGSEDGNEHERVDVECEQPRGPTRRDRPVPCRRSPRTGRRAGSSRAGGAPNQPSAEGPAAAARPMPRGRPPGAGRPHGDFRRMSWSSHARMPVAFTARQSPPRRAARRRARRGGVPPTTSALIASTL